MTVIVGVLCSDGVVIGSDSSATFGLINLPTVEQGPVTKVFNIKGCGIMAGTGSVGLLQRFRADLEKNWKPESYTGKRKEEIGVIIAQSAIQNFNQTYCSPPQIPVDFKFGALFSFFHNNEFHLIEFDPVTFQPEFKENHSIWYASMGSGMAIADSFLGLIRKVYWKDGTRPKLAHARTFVSWALDHAIDVNPGGINGPAQIAVLEKKDGGGKVRILTVDELQECASGVKKIEEHMQSFFNPPAPPKIPNA